MNQFSNYLRQFKTVGQVIFSAYPVVYVSGLGEVKTGEVVLMEGGGSGQVIDLTEAQVGVMLLSNVPVGVGERVARTGGSPRVGFSKKMLGSRIGSLPENVALSPEAILIDAEPMPIMKRKQVTEPWLTGVRLIDLLIPLALGQRELIVGQRKVEKSELAKQLAVSHARLGGVTIYAAIAKQQKELAELEHYFQTQDVWSKTLLVNSTASETAGRIFLTPYTAMAAAEFFRDQGERVLLIIDDLSIHSQHYRELSLLLRRFPGRNAYPGEIFYVHSRLLERAGNFLTGSITCVPIAEMVGQTLNEYIPTNLMAMTDGHLYFDSTLFNQGWRPAINPLVSVTRVGHQTQSVTARSLSVTLSQKLVGFGKLSAMVHFGGELTAKAQETLKIGAQLKGFFYQSPGELTPYEVSMVIAAGILGSVWLDWSPDEVHRACSILSQWYFEKDTWRNTLHSMIASSDGIESLIKYVQLTQEFEQLRDAVKEGKV